MTLDLTVRITDIVMILAVLLAPWIAVQVTEYLRDRKETRERRLKLFKTLMATRAARLAPSHVEALNMIDTEFHGKDKSDREVVEAWEAYLLHLNTNSDDLRAWGIRSEDLFFDLLFKMAVALGYGLQRSALRRTSYFPQGFGRAESEQTAIRRGLTEVLTGERSVKILIENPTDTAESGD